MTQHFYTAAAWAARRGGGLKRMGSVLWLLLLLVSLASSALADGMPSVQEEYLSGQANPAPVPSMPPVPEVQDDQKNTLAAEPVDMGLLGRQAPPPPPRWDFTDIPPWESLEEGLQLGLFPARSSGGSPFEMVILRIDPARFDFTVETASAEGRPLSLDGWATRRGLIAAINASMYLRDGITSTGYLRSGETINNGRIVSRFGAFFVAGPNSPDLPAANLLDRSTDDWEGLLPHYDMVVQNYRMISSERHLLWKPGGPKHSISAVARDGTGAILFILCRQPLTGVDFGSLLLALPIDIRVVMYTEGGSQAGLIVCTPARSQVWLGQHLSDFWTGGKGEPLPNVIGVRRRS